MDHWEEWQKVYQYGTLVIWPPDEVRTIVNRQRLEYDPRSAAICEAHITLTPPLLKRLSVSDWGMLNEIASRFQPFVLKYGPLKSFLPYPCIWYDVQPMSKVRTIREAVLETGFFDLTHPRTADFIPHMTITEGQSGPDVNEKLLDDLQALSQPGEFTVSEITFIKPDENFSFNVQRRIPLG